MQCDESLWLGLLWLGWLWFEAKTHDPFSEPMTRRRNKCDLPCGAYDDMNQHADSVLPKLAATRRLAAASFGNTKQHVDSYHCKRHMASHMWSDDGSLVPTTGRGFSPQAVATQATATQAMVIRHIVSVTGKMIRQVTSQEKPETRRRHPWP